MSDILFRFFVLFFSFNLFLQTFHLPSLNLKNFFLHQILEFYQPSISDKISFLDIDLWYVIYFCVHMIFIWKVSGKKSYFYDTIYTLSPFIFIHIHRSYISFQSLTKYILLPFRYVSSFAKKYLFHNSISCSRNPKQ